MNPRFLLGACVPVAVLLALSPVSLAGDDPVKPPAMPGADTPKPPAPPPGDERRGRFFDMYDANADGKVTKDEYTGDAALFDLLDTNHDGEITLAELGAPTNYVPGTPNRPKDDPMPKEDPANRQRRLDAWKVKLAQWDIDHDGKVTKEEYEQRKGAEKAPFERLDSNKDGVLDGQDGPGMMRERGAMGFGGPEAAMARFKELDKNGDGKVTKDEFPGRPERFAELDKDGDGGITPGEFEAAMRGGGGKGLGKGGGERSLFARFDKNGDGKVTRDEFPGSDEKFRELDKNGDGAITPEEAAEAGRDKEGKGRPGMDGEPRRKDGEPGHKDGEMGPKDGDGGGDRGPMNPPPMEGGAAPASGFSGLFLALDRDHDGRISRAEFGGDDEGWRRLDKNQDGWITPDEAK